MFFLLCPPTPEFSMPCVCLYLLSCPRVPTAPVTPDMKPKMVGRAGAVWGPLVREAGFLRGGGSTGQGSDRQTLWLISPRPPSTGERWPSRCCTDKVLGRTREARLGWSGEGSVLFKCSIASGPGPSDALSISSVSLCTAGPNPITQCPFLTRNTSARGHNSELEQRPCPPPHSALAQLGCVSIAP